MIDTKKIEKLEKQLAKICEEVYLANTQGRHITPLPPKIIVRVLPKEQKTDSGIYLPGSVSNKPMYEGIVVETWKPYDEVVRKKNTIYGGYDDKLYRRECKLKVGDRVLFAHFEGQPLGSYLDEKYYRMILDSCVQGTLNYESDATKVKQLKKLMEQFSSKTTSGATPGPGVPHWEPPASSSWFTS